MSLLTAATTKIYAERATVKGMDGQINLTPYTIPVNTV